MEKKTDKRRLPRRLAVIYADYCTGCEACIEVCPVDCIALVERAWAIKGTQAWCEIDLERCIGCQLCVRLPTQPDDAYPLTVCPWEAIEMVPTEQVAQAVARIGGPPEYLRENWDRLVGTAQQLAERKAAQR